MERDYSEIGKETGMTGFYSEYLPPCFKLEEEVFLRTPPQKCDSIKPYSYTMSRFNDDDARRTLFIPEIGAYVVMYNYIQQNDILRELIEFTENSKASFSPILGEDNTIMKHEESYKWSEDRLESISSKYIENMVEKIIRSAGSKKVLKLDISNCYSSFYMHMIPVIFLGLNNAEHEYNKDLNGEETSNEYTKYKKLDRVIRQLNLNRTNGLLSGPIISKMIIEGILTRIDMDLDNMSLKYSRYIDDYEVYLELDNEGKVINTFTKILKQYGFFLNSEKTKVIKFPYYIEKNLEKIFETYTEEELDNPKAIEIFNVFFTLEKDGTKGAVKYLLKSLEKNTIEITNTFLYKSYLLTIIKNNKRSLSKACTLLIANKDKFTLSQDDFSLIKSMLKKHINYEEDLETIWLLYLLVELDKEQVDDSIVIDIVNSKNELAHIILLRNELLDDNRINNLRSNASSWILTYELYVYGYIDEEDFISRLHLDKNIEFYKNLKQNGIHFVSG